MSSQEIMKHALAASVRSGKQAAHKDRILREKVGEIFKNYPGKREVDQKNRVMAALIEFRNVSGMFARHRLEVFHLEEIVKELIGDGLPVRWTYSGSGSRENLELID